jgi:hypothetical protein
MNYSGFGMFGEFGPALLTPPPEEALLFCLFSIKVDLRLSLIMDYSLLYIHDIMYKAVDSLS